MKKFVVALLAATLLASFAPASAQADQLETATKTLRVTAFKAGVNRVCPKGSTKMFIVKVFVRRDSLGTFAEGDRGVGRIVLRSGRVLRAEDYQVGPDYLESDYFFFAPSRFAKVKKRALRNKLTVELSGPNMKLRVGKLSSDCIESFGG